MNDDLTDIRDKLHADIADLVAQLDREIIGPEQYLDQLNAMFGKAMKDCEHRLGPKRFLELFGEAGRHPEDMVDKDTFYASQLARKRP